MERSEAWAKDRCTERFQRKHVISPPHPPVSPSIFFSRSNCLAFTLIPTLGERKKEKEKQREQVEWGKDGRRDRQEGRRGGRKEGREGGREAEKQPFFLIKTERTAWEGAVQLVWELELWHLGVANYNVQRLSHTPQKKACQGSKHLWQKLTQLFYYLFLNLKWTSKSHQNAEGEKEPEIWIIKIKISKNNSRESRINSSTKGF